jgi:NADPH:quinone reductase-like Zn-dependent oxidoreductase
VAPESRLAEKPSGLSFEEAAAVPGAGCTALQGLRDHGCVRAGQRVLVYGAGGGVGTFAVQIANALGAKVTAVTGTPNIDVVRPLGAAEVIDYIGGDVTTRNERYDVVFDVAATRPVADLLGIVSHGGTYVLVGAAKGGVVAILKRMIALQLQSRRLHRKVKTFLARVNAEDLEVLKGLIAAGTVRPVIDRTYRLDDAAAAVRLRGNRKSQSQGSHFGRVDGTEIPGRASGS